MKVKQIVWFLVVLCFVSSIEGFGFGGGKKSSGNGNGNGFGNGGGSGNLIQNVVTTIAGSPGVEGEGAPYEAFDHPVITPGGPADASYYARSGAQAGAHASQAHQAPQAPAQVYTAHVAPIQVQAQAIPLTVNTRVISSANGGGHAGGGHAGGSAGFGGNGNGNGNGHGNGRSRADISEALSKLLSVPQAILDQKSAESYRKQQQIQRGIDRVRLLIPVLADTVLNANGGGLRGGNNDEVPISIGNGHGNGYANGNGGHSQGIAIPVQIVQGGAHPPATSYGVPDRAPARSYGPPAPAPKPVYGPPAPAPKPVFTRHIVSVPVSVPIQVPVSIPIPVQVVTQTQGQAQSFGGANEVSIVRAGGNGFGNGGGGSFAGAGSNGFSNGGGGNGFSNGGGGSFASSDGFDGIGESEEVKLAIKALLGIQKKHLNQAGW